MENQSEMVATTRNDDVTACVIQLRKVLQAYIYSIVKDYHGMVQKLMLMKNSTGIDRNGDFG